MQFLFLILKCTKIVVNTTLMVLPPQTFHRKSLLFQLNTCKPSKHSLDEINKGENHLGKCKIRLYTHKLRGKKINGLKVNLNLTFYFSESILNKIMLHPRICSNNVAHSFIHL